MPYFLHYPLFYRFVWKDSLCRVMDSDSGTTSILDSVVVKSNLIHVRFALINVCLDVSTVSVQRTLFALMRLTKLSTINVLFTGTTWMD
jgi:hypothetical protein